ESCDSSARHESPAEGPAAGPRVLCRRTAAHPPEAGAGTPSYATEGETMSQGSVLIVDDDRALLQALPEALRLRLGGVTVETADCAAGARARIAVRHCDAIVRSIKKPGVDGLQPRPESRTR